MVLLFFRGVRGSFCWQSHERVQYWWITLPDVLWLLTIFSTREMLVETLHNGLISHNRTHTVFLLHIALIMCLECKQLFTLTKMAACHGGIQPSLKLSKHWIETSLRTLKKQLFEFVSLAGLDKMIFVISILFSPSPSSNEQAVTYAGCVWKIILMIFFHPDLKNPKKSHFT